MDRRRKRSTTLVYLGRERSDWRVSSSRPQSTAKMQVQDCPGVRSRARPEVPKDAKTTFCLKSQRAPPPGEEQRGRYPEKVVDRRLKASDELFLYSSGVG